MSYKLIYVGGHIAIMAFTQVFVTLYTQIKVYDGSFN